MFCKYCGRTIEAPEKPCRYCGKAQGTLCSTDGYFGILREISMQEKGIDMQNEEGKTLVENFHGKKEETERIIREIDVQKNTILKMKNEISAFQKGAEKRRYLGLIMAAFWLILAGSVFFQVRGQRIQKKEIDDIKGQEDAFEDRINDRLKSESEEYERYEQKIGELEQKIEELEQRVNESEKQVQNKEVLQKQIEKMDKQLKEQQKDAEEQQELIERKIDSLRAEIEEATTTVKKENGAENE